MLPQLLFILGVILAFSYSQDLTADSVPDYYTCGSLKPKTFTECTSLNTNDVYCCFMTNSRGLSFCYRFNSTEWTPSDTWEQNGRTYGMKCDVENIPPPLDSTNNTTMPTSNEGPSSRSNPPTSNEGSSSRSNPINAGETPTSNEDPSSRNNPMTAVETPRSTCGANNPTKSTDCTNENKLMEYCCYLTLPESNTAFCSKISPFAIQPYTTSYTIGSTSYQINCDIQPGSPGTPCGVSSPMGPDYCNYQSTYSNSCCYFSNDNMSYCLWLGFRNDEFRNNPSLIC